METPHRLLKERQRRERAELILEAAEAVFTEKGYHEASIDEIAVRVGVAKGTLYQHFASKEELVFALFESQIEMIQQVVEQAAASDLSARAKLEAILLHIYQGFMRKRTQLMLTLYESMELRREVLKQRVRIREHMDRLKESIRTILEEGKAAGEFEMSIATGVMLTTFFSLLSPRGYEWLVEHEGLTPQELVAQVGHTYFQGILSRGNEKGEF